MQVGVDGKIYCVRDCSIICHVSLHLYRPVDFVTVPTDLFPPLYLKEVICRQGFLNTFCLLIFQRPFSFQLPSLGLYISQNKLESRLLNSDSLRLVHTILMWREAVFNNYTPLPRFQQTDRNSGRQTM